MVKDANYINFYLEKAYEICKSGRPGPVFLDIPADMQNANIDEKKISKFRYYPLKTKYQIKDDINKIVKN